MIEFGFIFMLMILLQTTSCRHRERKRDEAKVSFKDFLELFVCRLKIKKFFKSGFPVQAYQISK